MIFYKLKQNEIFSKTVELFARIFFIPFKLSNWLKASPEGKTVLLSFHLLGDTVFTLPTVKYFSQKYEDRLVIACFENSKIIYKKAGVNAEFITFKRNDFFFSGRLPQKNIRKRLREINPFRIIDITGGIHSAFTIAGIGAKEIIGMNENIYKTLYDKFVPLRTKPHLIDKYFDVAKIFDDTLVRNNFSFLPDKVNGGNRILFHPFGSWKEKEWGFEKFIELAGKLKEAGYETSFIWEKGKAVGEKKIENLKNSNIEIIETKDLEDLFSEIEKSFLLISIDSGPVHIASLIGTSTIAIYGPTNPAFIKPEGENHLAIQNIIHCSPINEKHYCDKLAGRTCETLECLREMTVESVYNKTMEFIDNLTVGEYAG